MQAAAPITRGSGAHQVARQEEPPPSKPSVHLFQAVLRNAAGIPVPGRPRGPWLGRWGKEQQAQGSGRPGARGRGGVKAISPHAFSCRPGRGSALGAWTSARLEVPAGSLGQAAYGAKAWSDPVPGVGNQGPGWQGSRIAQGPPIAIALFRRLQPQPQPQHRAQAGGSGSQRRTRPWEACSRKS